MTPNEELEHVRNGMKVQTTDWLKHEFAEGLRITREHLLRMSVILAELEKRGEKVEGDAHLLKLFRRIASGSLLVDVVVRFAGRPYTLASVARTPIAEQEEILRMDDVDVEKKFRTERIANTGRPRSAGNVSCRETVDEATLERAAKAGTTKDVAEMCVALVEASENPKEVAERLIKALEPIAKQPPKKKKVTA